MGLAVPKVTRGSAAAARARRGRSGVRLYGGAGGKRLLPLVKGGSAVC